MSTAHAWLIVLHEGKKKKRKVERSNGHEGASKVKNVHSRISHGVSVKCGIRYNTIGVNEADDEGMEKR